MFFADNLPKTYYHEIKHKVNINFFCVFFSESHFFKVAEVSAVFCTTEDSVFTVQSCETYVARCMMQLCVPWCFGAWSHLFGFRVRRILRVCACLSPGYSGFLPQSKDMVLVDGVPNVALMLPLCCPWRACVWPKKHQLPVGVAAFPSSP